MTISRAFFLSCLVVGALVFVFFFGYQIGSQAEIKKQHEAKVAMLNTDADTVNNHVPEADIGAEIIAVNQKALEKAGAQGK